MLLDLSKVYLVNRWEHVINIDLFTETCLELVYNHLKMVVVVSCNIGPRTQKVKAENWRSINFSASAQSRK